MNENRYASESSLKIGARMAGGRTVLSNVGFTAPFKVTSPFYNDNGCITVMLISVSAGLMAGDSQRIDICVEDGATLRITSQAFEKIHKMENNGFAKRNTRLAVGKNAGLVYAPLPIIPFGDSSFRSETEILLSDSSSRFFQSEILSCGRASRGERFAYREYKSLIKIYKGGTLIYSDNTLYAPGTMHMERVCMFEGYTHMGSFLMINQDVSNEQIDALRTAVYSSKNSMGGMTRTGYGDYCVRALAEGSEPLMALGDALRRILRL